MILKNKKNSTKLMYFLLKKNSKSMCTSLYCGHRHNSTCFSTQSSAMEGTQCDIGKVILKKFESRSEAYLPMKYFIAVA